MIFSPSRRRRPMDFVRDLKPSNLQEYDSECPFCPGNEQKLSKIAYEVRSKDKATWATRAVYNKYPALTVNGRHSRNLSGPYLSGNGYGSHLVILESPRHDLQLSIMDREDLVVVVESYHHCYSMLAQDPNIMLIMLFKNYGESAGASLYHPHSQVVASAVVPRFIREREREEQRYFDEYGRCAMCDIIEFEINEAKRVIFQNQNFVIFVPFAAEVPCELWIVPKKHSADFNDISEVEKVSLAECLEVVMKKMSNRLNNPDYNFALNSCTRYKNNEPQLHWYLRIVPRLTTRAGFEIGSGMCINPSLPEIDAEFLRG